MKILITTDWYEPTINGVVVSVINLKTELTKRGHDVRILTLSETRHSFEKDNVIYIGAAGLGKIYPGARFSLPRVNEYIQELLEWKPDVIHSQCEFSTFMFAKRISRYLDVPIVHTYHTIYEDYTHYFSPVKSWGKEMVALFTNKVLKSVTTVIVPSAKVQKLLESYHVKKDIRIIPTGIDLEKFDQRLEASKAEQLKDCLGIPGNHKVIVIIGRLAKEKNIDEILTFFSNLSREEVTLLIVGDGPYREILEQNVAMLEARDRVVFTGMIPHDEVWKYYQLGDVFVSGSNSETQGLTYFEALANSVPVVCRRDPCVDDLLIDGYNGWQYEDFLQFSDQINSVFDDGEAYKANALESISSRFSMEQFAGAVEKVYYDTIQLKEKHKDRHLV